MKRDKKILNKRAEKQMDAEFKKLGLRPRVYHYEKISPTTPFNGVTVVTENPTYNWEIVAGFIGQSMNTRGFNLATRLLERLIAFYDLYGVAICDNRDTYSRPQGRRRAKRRLLRHLKGRDWKQWPTH